MKLNDGQTHVILFSCGKLYLDGTQIAGEGIEPQKDVRFEFKVNTESNKEEPVSESGESPEILSINVHDQVMGKGVGPGQV